MAKVVFFPKPGTIPVEVCPIRYGKSMLYTQDTDQLSTNGSLCEFLAFKNNVGATVFANSVNPFNQALASDFIKSGRIGLGVYFPTDRWINPSTQAYELIPDYLATTWTTVGEAAFENAVQGQPKTARTPNHGQQMYDLTNGRLGIDVVTGTVGSSGLVEFFGVADIEKAFIGNVFGKTPYVFSYRNGRNDTPIIYTQRFIGGRNSDSSIFGDSYTGYGNTGAPTSSDRGSEVNRPSSMRWWDFWHSLGGGTLQDADAYLAQEFAKTEANNGWFNDFTHWHTATDNPYYFDMIGGLLVAHNAYSCPYDEAIKYLFLKSLVNRITAKEVNGTILVSVEVRDIFKGTVDSGLPMDTMLGALDVPLSIKIDLSDTSLAGKDVSCNTGGCFLSGTAAIFELPLSNLREGILSATLSEGGSPEYINIEKPIINFTPSDSGALIETDQPCKIVAWDVSYSTLYRGDYYETTVSLSESPSHIGAITSRGQSVVISL